MIEIKSIMGRNGIMKREKMCHFLSFLFIFYPYMLMLNLKRKPPLTCKIEKKTLKPTKTNNKIN